MVFHLNSKSILILGLITLQIACNQARKHKPTVQENETEDESQVTPRPMEECATTYDLEKLKKLKLVPPKDSHCSWDIIGSEKCKPQLRCASINLLESEDCEKQFLKVTDGLGGEKIYCGKVSSFHRPLEASRGGKDLYIKYSGPQSGMSCKVSCYPGYGHREYLPIVQTRREDPSCTCGVQNQNDRDRIVNGEDAKMNEFPWQVAIVPTGTSTPICGGTLINDRYILTASHCFWFSETPPESVEILLHAYILDFILTDDWKDVPLGEKGSIRGSGWDSHNTTDSSEERIRLKVKHIRTHPLFTEKYDYDVALLRLEKKLNLKTINVSPICLPPIGDKRDYKGKTALVSGWGKSDELAGSTTRKLQKLVVPVLDTGNCGDMMGYHLTNRMLCAGFKQGERDACMGDSGGPLVVKKVNEQFHQIGIVSWGEGCARKNRPGIYSRLTELSQWVRRHTLEGEAIWCADESHNSDEY